MHIILPVTLALAGACALINCWLALRVGLLRIRRDILIGAGGDTLVETRMRAHANFVEYAPFVLLLVGLIELAGGTSPWLWAAAAIFVVARLLHPIGMERAVALRGAGAGITILLLAILGLYAAAIPFLSFQTTPATTIESIPPA